MAELVTPLQSQLIATSVDGPILLPVPSILQNPSFSPLHLVNDSKSVKKRDERDGKRRVRRKDNARFLGNVHIVQPTKKDYSPQLTHVTSTFREPIPAYLRTAKVPTMNIPAQDPHSANAGRFSMSLKGMRRDLRRSGFRAQLLVRDIELEIVDWLQAGGTVLLPDEPVASPLSIPGKPIGATGTISEVSRTPLQLIWRIVDDAFARYVVHCCARYREIVSFSKEVSGERLTYLLRPNVSRPDFQAAASLDTPPVSDIDYSSQLDTESDLSELDSHSEAGDTVADPLAVLMLETIKEDSAPSSPHVSAAVVSETTYNEGWSLVGDSDADGEESGSDAELVESVVSLSLQPSEDPDRTFRSEHHIDYTLPRSRAWEHRTDRSASSPSRSPARRPVRRMKPPPRRRINSSTPKSFYDYLYS